MADYGVLFHAAIETFKISAPTIIEAGRGTLSRNVCDERLRRWSGRLLNRVKAEVVVSGLEEIQTSDASYIVVSNHQSHYDIPALYATLPLSLRMAAKVELFKVPVWGQALRASGFVPIERKNPRQAQRALIEAGEKLKEGSLCLYVAPEGTRSSDGSVGRFKQGAFHLARAMNLPILPVFLSGTREIHQKGASHVQRGRRVVVRVLPPMAPSEFQSTAALSEHVRTTIVAAGALLGS